MISTPVLVAVLGSALLHAGWNCLVKASRERLLDAATLALGAALVAAVLVPWLPLPAHASLPWLGASVFVHLAYFLALIEAYRHADLSVAYPLMRGLAPAIVAFASPLFGEPVGTTLIAAVGLVCLGILVPAVHARRSFAIAPRGLGIALANAAIIALYTVVDGTGVRLAGNAISYTVWLFLLNAWGILAIAIWRRPGRLLPHLRERWHVGLLGAIASVGSYGIVLWAMSKAPIAVVAALRETSVVFAAVLGSVLLKEPMGRVRIGAAVLIALGVVAIRVG